MSDAGKWDVWYRGLAGWCATFRAGHCVGVDGSQSPFADYGQEHVFLIERPPPPA